MKVTEYVKCDHCGNPITKANDQNDVLLNSKHYDFCPGCYQELCGILDYFTIT